MLHDDADDGGVPQHPTDRVTNGKACVKCSTRFDTKYDRRTKRNLCNYHWSILDPSFFAGRPDRWPLD